MRPDDPQDLDSTLASYRRLPRVEPSTALDAAIQARARAAVATRSRPRWPVLFASAATLVLAASLGWRTQRHRHQTGGRDPEERCDEGTDFRDD